MDLSDAFLKNLLFCPSCFIMYDVEMRPSRFCSGRAVSPVRAFCGVRTKTPIERKGNNK